MTFGRRPTFVEKFFFLCAGRVIGHDELDDVITDGGPKLFPVVRASNWRTTLELSGALWLRLQNYIIKNEQLFGKLFKERPWW